MSSPADDETASAAAAPAATPVEQDDDDDESFFANFSVPKMLVCGAIGLVLGAGYSVVDQTLLHRKRTVRLPYLSETLERHMPDVVPRMEAFYAHRKIVRTARGKAEFDRIAVDVLKQCECFAALYARTQHTDNVTPQALGSYSSLRRQAKAHFQIIDRHLRTMMVLIAQRNNLQIEHDFNALLEAFQNRFWLMHQTVL